MTRMLHSKYLCTLLLMLSQSLAMALSEDEARAKLESLGGKCTVKDDHVRSVAFPKRSTPEQVALLEFFPETESVGAQHTMAPSESWQVLHRLPKLRPLVVWDSHEIQDLRVFAALPLKTLLLGGTMGLQKGSRQEDAILDVANLPNLTKFFFAHGINAKKDSHITHLRESFPQLTDLRIDIGPKENRTVTAAGIAKLASFQELTRLEFEGGAIPMEFLEIVVKAPKLKELVLRLGRPEVRVVTPAELEAFQAKYSKLKITIK